MADSLHFDVTRTKQDYAKAHRAYITRSKIFKAIWLLVTIFVALIVFVQVSKFINEPEGTVHWKGAVSLVVIYLTWVGLFYFISPAMAARSTRLPATSSQIVVNDAGIEEINPQVSIRAGWGMFSAALETSSYFFLFRGRAGFRFFPKASLGNEVIARFRGVIRKNVTKADLLNENREAGGSPEAEPGQQQQSQFPSFSSFQDTQGTGNSGGLNFKHVLTKDDYKRMFRSNIRRGNMAKILLILFVVSFVYFISDYVEYLLLQENIDHAVSGIARIVAIYVAVPSYIYFVYPARVARSAPDVGVEFDITVDDAGITVNGGVANSRFSWEYFVSALETADDFLLAAGGGFQAYPKRSLRNQSEIEQFRELIRAHVANAKLHKA